MRLGRLMRPEKPVSPPQGRAGIVSRAKSGVPMPIIPPQRRRGAVPFMAGLLS